MLSGANLALVPGACCVWALGVELMTGMLVSPWSGGGFLRNYVSEAQTGFKHLPSAPAFLFHLALSPASEFPTPITTPHNPLPWSLLEPCVSIVSAPKGGAGPWRAELRLCRGPRPTLSFCHRPGLSECDHD